jgi:hypothetical protein
MLDAGPLPSKASTVNSEDATPRLPVHDHRNGFHIALTKRERR